jgi:hypothetical protein
MSNVALRCTDPACAAHGRVQTTPTCATCGRPTVWTVLRVPPPGQAPVGPIYSTPVPARPSSTQGALPAGAETRTCTNPECARYHWVQDEAFCGACGHATVVARAL